MTSFPYSTNYHPPALEIKIGCREAALTLGPLAALIDTGADGTILPRSLITQIAAPLIDKARIRGQWSEWRVVRLFAVDIGIAALRLPTVEVVGEDLGEEIILRRNVLNRLELVLSGPRRRTEIGDA